MILAKPKKRSSIEIKHGTFVVANIIINPEDAWMVIDSDSNRVWINRNDVTICLSTLHFASLFYATATIERR